MKLKCVTTIDPGDPAEFISDRIVEKLRLGKKVLLFLTGGSSVIVGGEIARILKKEDCQNLTVMLTDERYGPVNHAESNWQQLIDNGFDIPTAKLIPILDGTDIETTTKEFNENLEKEFELSEYTIGLFGIGTDMHTAGILPGSPGVTDEALAASYSTPTFKRVTMTTRAIQKVDEAVVWIQGEEKRHVLETLQNEDNDILKQPSQVLKQIPLLTFFTNISI